MQERYTSIFDEKVKLKNSLLGMFRHNLTYACTGRLYIKLYIKHGIGYQESKRLRKHFYLYFLRQR